LSVCVGGGEEGGTRISINLVCLYLERRKTAYSSVFGRYKVCPSIP
jgi:hypothetical protein